MQSKAESLSTGRRKGQVYGVLAALTFTTYVLINRYVYSTYDIETFRYTATFLVSGGLFAGLSLIFRAKNARRSRLFHRHALLVAANGLLAGIGIGMLVFGQAFTTAINASIISSATVLTTAVFSWAILKERFNSQQLKWLIIMFFGVYFAIVGTRLISFNKGDVIIFLAICVLGSTNVFSKILMKTYTSNFVADIRLLSGGILFFLLGLFVSGGDFLVLSADLWPVLSGLAFWATIRLAYASIHLTSPNEAMVLSNCHPFFTALAGVVLLSEPYSFVKFVGSAVVLSSVYFITKKSR